MWSEQENELLTQVLDELIPPSRDGRVPGAGMLGVGDFFLTKGSLYVDNPLEAVRSVLQLINKQTDEFGSLDREARVALLKQVQAEYGVAFSKLLRLTYMAYYSRPDTRPLFGVGAHPVHPQGYPVPAESQELLNELTGPVRARGAIYRA